MDYWANLTQLTKQAHHPALTAQYTAMQVFRDAVAQGELPKVPLPRLGMTEAIAFDLMRENLPLRNVNTLDHLLRNFRQYIAYHYGMWAFVQQQLFVTWTALFGRQRYLEIAAGNGYLSYGLQQAGNQVIATDARTWQKENLTGATPLLPIHQAGETAALLTYGPHVDAVVMAWSPDHEWNDAALLWQLRQHFPSLPLFVLGERNGATNSRLFWQLAQFVPDRRLLKLNRAFPRFDAINDRIYLIQ